MKRMVVHMVCAEARLSIMSIRPIGEGMLCFLHFGVADASPGKRYETKV
ncbi:UNVERIFIED_ORG: hypothetical protein BDU10_9924 [Burkholderia sp. CF145]|jgi:hypothetical protein|nr:hypothetical protein PMI06_008573 [Burkholderia sp. BT03]SKC49641.1 hypothetical protein SAMN06266956_0296 [Paraburkholderia hospita]SKD05696.1 hypothetical protein SAMN05445504_9571 [Burkholderia sp. CF099]